jgi:hypothetical protein
VASAFGQAAMVDEDPKTLICTTLQHAEKQGDTCASLSPDTNENSTTVPQGNAVRFLYDAAMVSVVLRSTVFKSAFEVAVEAILYAVVNINLWLTSLASG